MLNKKNKKNELPPSQVIYIRYSAGLRGFEPLSAVLETAMLPVAPKTHKPLIFADGRLE